ncbi:Fe-S cluster assembly sulfur transfer protein SufU [uncultured Clostridium sp.]|uniref:Fe-S cluster assembly sulfur transfer protein SufU n=1 Tax=uncultured Clostridium sp. TaxID=59620 RepID=UPI00261FC877|nr:SUF system NifU family Fe-S cluster assembly protein [uncultured Clostridium sp.]
MELNDVYTEIIMEHNMSKRNRRNLQVCDACEKGHNPSCGDEITIQVKYNGDIIEDIAFGGKGCAISQASTSMMIDLVKGKTKKEAKEIIDKFIGMIKREIKDEDELEELEDAIVLQNISNMPARVKCAVLAWHTLDEMMKNEN